MDIHEWIGEFAARAVEARDRERYQLVALTGEALPQVSRDPDRALALLEEGRALAERLDEPRFLRFFEHWMIQALLFHKRDPLAALPLAEGAVAATAAPAFADFPQRVCLREDLIFSYLSRDPAGHAARIEQAVEYMRAGIAPDCPCLHCLHEIRTAYPLALGRLDEAERAALEAVRLAWPASDYHHVLIAFASLCQIAHARADWPKLAHWSGMGRTFDGRGVGVAYVNELLLWGAVSARRAGDEAAARSQYRQVRGRTRGQASVPTAGHFDALFAFHGGGPEGVVEGGADPRPALAVCDLELAGLAGRGETARECTVRLRRLRLLSRLGRPAADEQAAIRALAGTLADAGPVLAALADG